MMLYNLIKNTMLDAPIANTSINWPVIRFIIRVICIMFVIRPIYKIIEWIFKRTYCYDIILIILPLVEPPWDSVQQYIDFYKINDELRDWLKKHNIDFFQTIDDTRIGKFRFYFKREEDAMAFKLRWV